VNILAKAVGKMKYLVALLLTCLIVMDKAWNLGLGMVAENVVPMEYIMTIWAAALGIDMVEGVNARRMAAKENPKPPIVTPGTSGSGVTTP
jgi:hypothetical protein